MTGNEYSEHDGLALGELVRRGAVSASELLDAALERLDRHAELNAVVFRDDPRARDAARTRPAGDGPFEGVPLLLKDILGDCAGMPSRYGSAYVPPLPADTDSTLVARFKAAGFVPFAKTNAPEFGLPPITESKLYGPARNPWDTSRTPGGSSGGSAAAVAAGIVPIAHANDGGGSIRIPAAACGLVGLKPTRGRNPLGPLVGDVMNGLVAEHVVTRTVRDTAAVLDATAGYATGDPYAVAPPARPFLAQAQTAPRPLRIAFSKHHPYGRSLDPQILAAVDDAAHLCASLGHNVEEAVPAIPIAELGPVFLTIYATGLAMEIATVSRLLGREPGPDDIEPMSRNFLNFGRRISGSDYLLAVGGMQAAARTFAAFFEHYDVWLTPTLGALPFPIGTVDVMAPDATLADPRFADFALHNPLYNLSGQPAITLPLSATPAGLPIGVLFGAGYAKEGLLLSLAGQLEAARPWIGRRPPVWG